MCEDEVNEDELLFDDEVVVEDLVSLIGAFIDRSIANKFFDDPPQPVIPAVTGREKTVICGGRLHFVITKNRSSSWAEDLSDMVSIKELTRVFN